MSFVFHELMDIVVSGLPALFFLSLIAAYVFGGGLADLIEMMSLWALG